MSERTVCLSSVILFAAVIAVLGWFSTQQIEHGKRHTHYTEVRR